MFSCLPSVCLLLFCCCSWASMQMLGLGGGGGTGMVKGSSFNLDTKERITRVHGAGVKLDLELLEVSTAGGSLLFTPTHIELTRGLTRWMKTFNEGKLSLHHNDKTVLQIYTPDESPYYLLSMKGNAAFRDVILDKALSNSVAFSLCIVDSVFDESLTQAACEVRAESSHLTVSQSMENIAKSLLYVSEFVSSGQKNLVAGIIESVDKSLVGPFKIDVESKMDQMLRDISVTQEDIRAERDSISERLIAIEISSNATISALISDVADATTVTLSAISNEASSNLTKLEKAVYRNFLDLNTSLEQRMNDSALAAHQNLSFVKHSIEEKFSNLHSDTLPALREALNNETKTLLDHNLDSLEARVSRNLTHVLNAAYNFTIMVQSNASKGLELFSLEVANRSQELAANLSHHETFTHFALDNLTNSMESTKQDFRGDVSRILVGISLLNQSISNVSHISSLAIQRNNDTVHSLAEDASRQLEDLRVASTNMTEQLRGEVEGEMKVLRGAIESNFSTLHAELEARHQSTETAQSNLSTSLSRSHAALSLMIDGVNQTVSDLASATSASFEEVERNVSSAFQELRFALHDSSLNVSATARSELNLTRRLFFESVRNSSDHLSADMAGKFAVLAGTVNHLNASLLAGLSGERSQRERALEDSERSLAESVTALNSSLSSRLSLLNASLEDNLRDANTSAHESVSHLAENVSTTLVHLKRMLVDLAREVYSPLEVDSSHEVPTAEDHDNLYRVGRMRRSRGRTAPPVRYINEELRVDVDGELLNALDFDYGGGISRSAAIEKDLLLLQEALSHIRDDASSNLTRAFSNISSALEDGLKTANASVKNASMLLMGKLEILNSSIQEYNADSVDATDRLNSSLRSVNASISESMARDFNTLTKSIVQSRDETTHNVSKLWHVVNDHKDATSRNMTDTNAKMDAMAHELGEKLQTLESKTEEAAQANFKGLSNRLGEATALWDNHLKDLRLAVSQNASNLESRIGASNAAASEAIAVVNSTLGKAMVDCNSRIERLAELQHIATNEHHANITEAELRMNSSLRLVHSEITTNVTELGQALSHLRRMSDKSVEGLNQSLSALTEQHRDHVSEQVALWRESSAAQEDFNRENIATLQAMNNSLLSQLTATSETASRRLRYVNESVLQRMAETNSSIRRLLSAQAIAAQEELEKAKLQSQHFAEKLSSAIQELESATAQNITSHSVQFSEQVAGAERRLLDQCNASLAVTASTLLSTVKLSHENTTKEMSSLSTSLRGALESALDKSSKSLDLFSGRVSGQLNLTEYRVAQAEAQLQALGASTQALQQDVVRGAGNVTVLERTLSAAMESQRRHDELLWSLQNSSSRVASSVHQLHGSVSQTSTQILVLEQSMQGVATNFSLQNSALQSAVSMSREFQSYAHSRFDALKDALASNEMTVRQVQSQLGGNLTLPAVRAEVSAADAKADFASRAAHSLDGKLEALRAELQSSKASSELMERKLDSVANGSLRVLSKEIEDVDKSAKKGLEHLENGHDALTKAISESEDKIVKLEQRLALSELLANQQEKRVEALAAENERLRRSSASQESVDELRKLLQDLQASMIAQSSKVLDLIVGNLADKSH